MNLRFQRMFRTVGGDRIVIKLSMQSNFLNEKFGGEMKKRIFLYNSE